MSESEQAIALAIRILDRVNADPDDDLAVLARQLIRAREALDRAKIEHCTKVKCPSCGIELAWDETCASVGCPLTDADFIEAAARRIAHDDHRSSLCAVPDWDGLSEGLREALRRHAAAAAGTQCPRSYAPSTTATKPDVLVERLRENAALKQGEAWRRRDGGQDLCIGAQLAEDAADEIQRLREQLETAQSIHANEVRMHSKTREQVAAAISLRWQNNLVFIVSRADFGNSSLTMRQIEEIIEDDGLTMPKAALERWRPYNSVAGRPDPMTPPSTTVA